MKKILIFLIPAFIVLISALFYQRYKSASAIPTTDMTPVEVVELYFEGVRTKNVKTWFACLTEQRQAGFKDARSGESSLLSFEMHEIYQLTEGEEVERQKKALLEGGAAESAENIAFVYAEYTVEYDPTKNPFSGRRGWVYTLYRTDEASPWLISDWGVGHFSIAFTGD